MHLPCHLLGTQHPLPDHHKSQKIGKKENMEGLMKCQAWKGYNYFSSCSMGQNESLWPLLFHVPGRRRKHRCRWSISGLCHNFFKVFLLVWNIFPGAYGRPFLWAPSQILTPLSDPPSATTWLHKARHRTLISKLEEVDFSGLYSKISLYIFFQHSWVKGQTEIWKQWLLPLWGRRIPTELGTYMNSDLQSFPLFMRSLDLLLLSPIYKELWLDQGKEY